MTAVSDVSFTYYNELHSLLYKTIQLKEKSQKQTFADVSQTRHAMLGIKKIRTQKGRPDSDKIFKETVKESATNFTLEDIQQAL